METQKKKFFSKENLFTEWVFSCIYWGVFFIIYRFATNAEASNSILQESGWILPIISIYMYLVGVYFVFMEGSGRVSPISRFAALFCKPKKTPPQC